VEVEHNTGKKFLRKSTNDFSFLMCFYVFKFFHIYEPQTHVHARCSYIMCHKSTRCYLPYRQDSPT